MTKSPSQSNKLVARRSQIVPKGYWTFWFVMSLLCAIGAGVMAFLWWPDRTFIAGVLALVSGVAWAVVYWRVRHAK